MTSSLFTDPVTIEIAQQLIVGNRLDFKNDIRRLLEDGVRRIIVDLSRTGYVDSSGLGVLVSVAREIAEHKASVVLIGLNEDLKTLFEMTRLDTLFVVADTVQQAEEHLRRIRP